MEINHCYPDSSDSSLSSSNQHKHLGSPSAAFCKMSWGVLMEREETRRRLLMAEQRLMVVGGGVLGETVISTRHQCAGALHKPPRAVSKCCWQIKAIMEVAVAVRGSPVYSPSHCTFTPSPAHRCEIMVFAFICQRSIFQTSDKRGNWTGNRPKCCKSTKHNYQKALKLPNRIHILKMLKWTSPIHNESCFCSSATSFFWSRRSALLQWSMVSTQPPPPGASLRINGLLLGVNGSLWELHYGCESTSIQLHRRAKRVETRKVTGSF